MGSVALIVGEAYMFYVDAPDKKGHDARFIYALQKSNKSCYSFQSPSKDLYYNRHL